MTKRSIQSRIILFVFSLLLLAGWGSSLNAEEGRGVWIHASTFSNTMDEALVQMRKTLDDYRSIGINRLYCFYPLMEDHQKGWDFLKELVREAHGRSIKVEPIIMPGNTVALRGEILDHPEWLIRGMKGEIYPNLNIADPEVRKYLVRKISEMLAYDIDGIHLDYIRFPVNQNYSYDAATGAAFKKEYGFAPLEVSHDNGSMVWCEWIRWNARQVTTLVRDVRELLRKSGRNLTLSAAVFPEPVSAGVLIGQEWGKWPGEKLVDVLCPMLYTNDMALFREYVREAVRLAKGNSQVYAGIACTSSHNKNTPDGVAQQVAIAREEGAAGVVFFSGSSLTREFMDRLGTTVFAQKGK